MVTLIKQFIIVLSLRDNFTKNLKVSYKVIFNFHFPKNLQNAFYKNLKVVSIQKSQIIQDCHLFTWIYLSSVKRLWFAINQKISQIAF